ncbi:glycosyltransferase [Fulvimarina sp. MAC3]|uniref:glycosyltransferase n=1 Tax=Fulvimarina sp. MAC3 TaxID=3148887 RepID=UPI0031FDFCB9
MNLLLASGTPHMPQLSGGLEVNSHLAALELNRRGHRASVLAKLSVRDGFGMRKFVLNCMRRSDVSIDRELGYNVYRSMRPWRDIRGLHLPDVVVIQNGNMVEMGRNFRQQGIASIAYLHGLEFESGPLAWQGNANDLPFSAYIANSQFTATKFERRFGIRPNVIPPIFPAGEYRTVPQGRFVTFINPVPVKGRELAFEIAERCPEIPFLFVRGWPLSNKAESDLQKRAGAAGNIRLLERQRSMKPVYEQTRVLLAPSQWEETWGRVASEAHFSGIPVLASLRGGLPEAVGAGGQLLAHDASPDQWADTLRKMWSDDQAYEQLSRAAAQHAARSEIDIREQTDRLVEIAKAAA